MAESDESGAAAERWAARNDDRFQKVRPTLFKGWQLLAFFLIAVVTAGIGVFFKSGANPGTESQQFASQAPLAVDFFVTNPEISVQALMGISFGAGSTDFERVSAVMEAPPHTAGSVLVLSSLPVPQAHFYRLIPPKRIVGVVYSRQVPFDSYYANEFALPRSGGPKLILNVVLKSKVIEKTNASEYGHLPSIGDVDNPSAFALFPPLMAYRGASGHLANIVLEPGGTTFITPQHGTREYFALPKNFKTAETFYGLGPLLKSEQLDYLTPAATIIGDNYTWKGAANLEPTFEITNQDAAQAESNDAFLSGIFFAVAGGATIALIQAVPRHSPGPHGGLGESGNTREARPLPEEQARYAMLTVAMGSSIATNSHGQRPRPTWPAPLQPA